MGLESASVRPAIRASVRASTLSNMNISETSWPIIIKFHQKHHCGGGLIALGFGKVWIRKSRMGSKFSRIRPGTYELAALERLEKSP